jgi:hypothetical protein
MISVYNRYRTKRHDTLFGKKLHISKIGCHVTHRKHSEIVFLVVIITHRKHSEIVFLVVIITHRKHSEIVFLVVIITHKYSITVRAMKESLHRRKKPNLTIIYTEYCVSHSHTKYLATMSSSLNIILFYCLVTSG